MPILPNILEDTLFFKLNQAPGPVWDIFSAAAFRIVLAGIRLNIFETLEKEPLLAQALAAKLQASEHGILLLLGSLEAFGYVQSQNGIFRNTAMTKKWLLERSAANISAGFEYWGTILTELWSDLETTICNGRPEINLYQWIEHEPHTSTAFQTWMVGLAQLIKDEVLGKLKLPAQAKRLLDIGGGHGLYSLAFSSKYPKLTATVFDFPQALNSARAYIAASGMDDRVSVQEGDFLKDDLGRGYDVTLLFNIVHGFSPEQNRTIINKAVSTLNPRGMIVLAEQVKGRTTGRAAKAITHVLEMSYFQLLDGQVYTYKDIAGWLEAAGCTRLRRMNLLKAPGTCLIVGEIPAKI